MTGPFSPLEAAARLADDLLFPTARATDAGGRVPRSHLDRLADAGLYGPLGLADGVVEALAGGCLSTTFVWVQHHSTLRAVAASTTAGLRERWLDGMERGKWRAGVAVAGIRPGVNGVSARAVDGGWRVNGVVPWVTGWGLDRRGPAGRPGPRRRHRVGPRRCHRVAHLGLRAPASGRSRRQRHSDCRPR